MKSPDVPTSPVRDESSLSSTDFNPPSPSTGEEATVPEEITASASPSKKTLKQRLRSLTPKLSRKPKVSTRTSSLASIQPAGLDLDSVHISKEQAVQAVSNSIRALSSKRDESLRDARNHATMALARYDSSASQNGSVGNIRGAILSMKKFKASQRTYLYLDEVVIKLGGLRTGLESDTTSPELYERLMKEIVENTKRQSASDLSDEQLIQELKSGDIAKFAS